MACFLELSTSKTLFRQIEKLFESLSFVTVNKTPFKIFEVRGRLGQTSKYFDLAVNAFASPRAI